MVTQRIDKGNIFLIWLVLKLWQCILLVFRTFRLIVSVLWLTIVLASFTVAGHLIASEIQVWNDSPVITTIESTSVPIESVPFPSGKTKEIEQLPKLILFR